MQPQKYQAITACAFIYKDGKVFVAKRAENKNFLPGKFELVGGHTEFGETLQDSLVREIREEIGIEIIVGDPFYAFTYVSNNDTKHSVEIVFFATISDPEQKITLNPQDHSEYRWLTEDDARKLLDQEDEEAKAINIAFNLLKKQS